MFEYKVVFYNQSFTISKKLLEKIEIGIPWWHIRDRMKYGKVRYENHISKQLIDRLSSAQLKQEKSLSDTITASLFG